MRPAVRPSIAHVAGLDGLRGLAVLGVLLFHANGLLRGGYLGVDLFFVLSGFLITSILLAERGATGTIDLRQFWVRRARRLLPALLCLVPAIALYARTLAAPGELASLRADALATLGYVANWRAILVRRSYWEMFAAPSPLEHTWSLAIEEQFYVVWPLVVLGVLAIAHGRVRALLWTCVALGLASCAAMAILYDGGDSTRVYLGTDTRGAAILAGAALAASPLGGPGKAPRGIGALSGVALAALAAAWWRLDGQSDALYRGGFWATELAALVLVVACVRAPGTLVARALSVRPLRALGTISYGVYLWHWPLYVILSEERVGFGGARLLALRLACTLAVASVSYRALEEPIRRRGLAWGRPAFVVPATFSLAIAFIFASTRVAADTPLAARGSAETFVPSMPDAAADGASVRRAARSTPEEQDTTTAETPAPPWMLAPASELPAGTTRILVLGDSVGLSLGSRMFWDQRAERSRVAQRAIGDCSILAGVVPVRSMDGGQHGNGDCARNWVGDVAELRPDVTLVVIGGAFFSTVKSGGRWRTVCEPGWHDAYAKRLAELLGAIAPNAGRRVVALAPYPVGRWETPTLDERVDCYNRTLRDAADAAGADVLDLASRVCPARECAITSEGAPVRPDGLHFDGLGAVETSRWVLGELRRDAVRVARPGDGE